MYLFLFSYLYLTCFIKFGPVFWTKKGAQVENRFVMKGTITNSLPCKVIFNGLFNGCFDI